MILIEENRFKRDMLFMDVINTNEYVKKVL